MKRLIALGAVVLALISVPTSAAKDFGPGDLRLCNTNRCAPIENRPALRLLAAFYYGAHAPAVAPSPRLGARSFELRFTNGYVTGIVTTRNLDRFLSYGVYVGRFRRGTWYVIPACTAHGLRKAAGRLVPLPLTRAAVQKSR